MNNFERIKKMTVDEMAEYFDKWLACIFCEQILKYKNQDCMDFCFNKRGKRIKQWLLEEQQDEQ